MEQQTCPHCHITSFNYITLPCDHTLCYECFRSKVWTTGTVECTYESCGFTTQDLICSDDSSPRTIAIMGYIYAEGMDKRNHTLAQQMLRTAAKAGDCFAQCYLATYQYTRLAIHWEEIIMWYGLASGHTSDPFSLHAQSALAKVMYGGTNLIAKNEKLAISIWHQLAEKNIPHAMYMLGSHYYTIGDACSAITWWKKACDLNHAPSYVEYAMYLLSENPAEGVKYLLKSGDLGYPMAYNKLAELMSTPGDYFNLQEALVWAERGVKHKLIKCDEIYNKLTQMLTYRNYNFQSQDNKAKNKLTECAICMENERKVACVPCGHQCLCFVCSWTLDNTKKCPICKQDLKMLIQTFE